MERCFGDCRDCDDLYLVYATNGICECEHSDSGDGVIGPIGAESYLRNEHDGYIGSIDASVGIILGRNCKHNGDRIGVVVVRSICGVYEDDYNCLVVCRSG